MRGWVFRGEFLLFHLFICEFILLWWFGGDLTGGTWSWPPSHCICLLFFLPLFLFCPVLPRPPCANALDPEHCSGMFIILLLYCD